MLKKLVLLSTVHLALPVFAYAQVSSSDAQSAAVAKTNTSANAASDAELHTTIMNAVMQDPRAASLPPEQLQEMINTLEDAAKTQGIDSQAITETDQTYAPDAAVRSQVDTGNCTGLLRLLCAANSAFGFDGSNPDYTFYLWALAGVCFMLLAIFELRLHRGEWHFLTHNDDGSLKQG